MKKLLSLLLAVMMLASCIPAFADDTWKITPEGALSVNSGVKLSGEVVIPETVDGITVTSLDGFAFNNQTDVTSIVMPDTVQSMGSGAINFLDGVTSLKLSENLTVISDMNGILKGLTELTIPASVRYIGDAFTSMKSMQTLTFEGVCPVFNSQDPLHGISRSAVIYVPDDQVDAYKAALAGGYDIDELVQSSGKNAVVHSNPAYESDFVFDAATGTITGYTGVAAFLEIPTAIGGTPVKAIGEKAFYDNAALFYVIIPEGIESIGNSAFTYCDSLTVVEFPTTLKKIGDNAFDGCYLDYVGWAEGLEEIGASAFARLAIRDVRLPSTVKTIGEAAFKNGTITNLYIGNAIESIGAEAFANNYIERLELLVDRMIQIDETAFAGNTYETTVLLRWNAPYDVYKDYEHLFMDIYPGYVYLYIQAPIKDPSLGLEYPADGTDSYNQDVWVSYNGTQPNLMTWYSWNRIPITTLGDGLFKGNQTIRSWYPSHEFTMHHIGNEAFADSSVEIVDIFHEIYTIGDAAFRNCVNIKEITLPETLTSIAANAFEGCTGLEKITILCDPSILPAGLLDSCTALKEVSAGENATDEQKAALQKAVFGKEIVITQQPADVTVGEGGTANIEVQLESTEGLHFTWYVRNAKDKNFVIDENQTGSIYSVVADASCDGRMVYCVISDDYGTSAETDAAMISIAAPVQITKQPEGATLPEGAQANVTIEVAGESPVYAWYVNDALYADCTGNVFNAPMSAELDGAQVYCVVTDAYGKSASSEKAVLKMAAQLAITAQPATAELPEGEMTNITVEATGDGLAYQWYVMPVSKSEFAAAEGFNTNVYSVPVDFDSDWSQVYCVITDAYGNSVTSETASIFIAEPEIVIPEVTVDANYVGRWTSTKADADGMNLDRAQLEQFGMVMDLDLNEDGSAVFSMMGEEEPCTWGVANGFLYFIRSEEVMEMTIPGDGTISYEGVIFEMDGAAPAAPAEPAAPVEEAPAAAVSGEAADFIVGSWNAVSGESDGMTLDASMMEMFGLVVTLNFNADGSGVLAMEGEEEGPFAWSIAGDVLSLEAEGDVMTAQLNADDTFTADFGGVYLTFAKADGTEEASEEMSDEELLALLAALAEMEETEGGFVGTWYACYVSTGGFSGDMRPMGVNYTLVLREDGNGSVDFPEYTEGIWYEENGFTYFGQGGDNADMPMALLDGGFLQYGSDLGGFLILSQDENAVWDPSMDIVQFVPVVEATAEPVITEVPAAGVTVDAPQRMNKKFVATGYTSFGYTLDASMLGAEYALYFREDGTCDFTMGGMTIPNLQWNTQMVDDAEAYVINYYGTLFNAVLTDTGFDLDFYGTMTLHFVPAE